MQYDVHTVSEYISALDDDWRKDLLLEIRDYILASAKNIREGIEYKMLLFEDELGGIFHLNAQKNYVGLYIGDISKIDSGSDYLKDMDCGKGCIRIKKSYSFKDSNLQLFIDKAISMHQMGMEHGC